MRFSFTIHADNQEELVQGLAHLQASLPANLFAKNRHFSVDVYPSEDPFASAPVTERVEPAEGRTTVAGALHEPAAPTEKAAKKRGKKAEENQASNQAEISDNQDNQTAEDADPLGLGIEEVAAAAAVAELTPAEARAEALALLKEVYGREGGAEPVKAVQKAFGGKPFSEIPDSRAHELLAAAKAVASQVK